MIASNRPKNSGEKYCRKAVSLVACVVCTNPAGGLLPVPPRLNVKINRTAKRGDFSCILIELGMHGCGFFGQEKCVFVCR